MRIEGQVVHGKRVGRSIGFPTANLQADNAPEAKNGVYAAWFFLDGRRLPCMLNIGAHPTVPGGAPTIEAHIFDFSEDIYGRRVAVETAGYLRGEVRFSDINALREQLMRDRAHALELLRGKTE